MNDTFFQFRDAIRATGMEPPALIEPGKLHRFPGVGKRRGNTAGWCKLFDDGEGGCFGDWSSGLSETWQAPRKKPYSAAKRAAFASRADAARKKARDERRMLQSDAADCANKIWNAAPPAPSNHPYLVRKGIQSHNARLHKGLLTLPIRTRAGHIASLQFIDDNGNKRLLSGGRKRDCFIQVNGDWADGAKVIICEGWATGCTLAESEPNAFVVAAIDAGNLEPVAVVIRQHWPLSEIVIAGDDDRLTPDNPGATKARAAALASDALLALPEWPDGAPETLTDFNDLALWLAGGGR